VPSADRTRLVVPRADQLLTFLSDGSDERVIPLDGFFPNDPTWSADGSEIAFSGAGPGERYGEIWIVGHDGAGLRKLTDLQGRPSGPGELAWSPDGADIAFVAGGVIYRVDVATGRDVRELRTGSEPSWSPDASQIAFLKNGIRIMDRDGTFETVVSDMTATAFDWSFDGTQLVASNGNTSIWAMTVDGSDVRKIAATQDNSTLFPVFSPDGCEVAYNDVQLSTGYVNRARVDGSGFSGAWFGATRSPFDWSFAPSPTDAAGDLAPHVDLLAPIGGELLRVGENYEIEWRAWDDAAIVEQDLFLIVDDVETTIALGLAGDVRAYTLSVPDLPTDADNRPGARVRIEVRDASGQEHRATSKYSFSIAGPGDTYHALRLTWPVGGETVHSHDVIPITWESDIVSSFTPDGFHLELSLDGGNTFRRIIYDFSASDDRSYIWVVPSATSGEAVVRIRQGSVYDESAPFVINPDAVVTGSSTSPGRIVLYGVRAGGDAVLSWDVTASPGLNLHRTARKQELVGLWLRPPLATGLVGEHPDPEPPPGDRSPWYYQVFAVGCRGDSAP